MSNLGTKVSLRLNEINGMLCAICYHLFKFKKVKNTHAGVLSNFTKSNTPPRVFFSSFLIVQMVADPAKHHKSEAELNLLDKL